MPIRWTTDAPKPISQGEDIARSTGTGLLEGGASIPGVIGDLRNLGQSAVNWGAKQAGIKGPVSLPMPGLPGSQDALLVVRALAERAGLDPAKARMIAAMMPGGLGQAPSSQDILKDATKGKPLYQPQTRAGKYARTISQFAPAAATPGGVVRRAANVVVPGAASEAAGQATEGTKFEPYARVAAAILGGGTVALAGRGGPDTRILSEASRGATDAQINAARQLMEEGARRGVRLTMAEALQQVTNSATGMGRLQRVVEGTRGGNAQIGPVMAQRPQQVAQAVRSYADEVAQATPDPYVAAGQAQEAASGVLNDVRQAVNANARPWYDALREEVLPPANETQALMQNPAYREALGAVRSNPVLNETIAQLPDNNLAVVNEVVKQLDTLAENARPNPANPVGNAQMSAAYDAARNQADQLASAVSEPWRLSRSMVASGREAFLEPLQAGPMGAISQSGKPASQTGALFPSQPPEGAAGPTSQTLQMLPQDVGRGLVRQQVMGGFNEASQDLIGGPNQWGGAKWAAGVAGNPEQAAVLNAGVEAVGAPPINPLIDVMRATGRRERPGSLTAYNARDIEELGKAGMVGEVGRTGLNPPGTFRRIGQALQDWQTERNAGRLAEAIIANPAEAERILLRAREVVPAGPELRAIERAALAAQLSRPQLETQ